MTPISERTPFATWATSDEYYNKACPDLLALINLNHVIHVEGHSADCEIGFSHSTIVKLGRQSFLSDLGISLAITLHSPASAVVLWNATANMRPDLSLARSRLAMLGGGHSGTGHVQAGERR